MGRDSGHRKQINKLFRPQSDRSTPEPPGQIRQRDLQCEFSTDCCTARHLPPLEELTVSSHTWHPIGRVASVTRNQANAEAIRSFCLELEVVLGKQEIVTNVANCRPTMQNIFVFRLS